MNAAETMGSTAPFRTQSGLTPYSGPFTEADLVHLLRRTMFGVKRSDLSYFKGRTLNQVVGELLTPTAPSPAPPVKEYTIAATPGVNPDTTVAQGTTWVNNFNNDGTVQSLRPGVATVIAQKMANGKYDQSRS